jgi:hypothetical protein
MQSFDRFKSEFFDSTSINFDTTLAGLPDRVFHPRERELIEARVSVPLLS